MTTQTAIISRNTTGVPSNYQLPSFISTIPGGFAPTQIANCALWLDGADSTCTPLSGTTVTRWIDKSGNNNSTTTTNGTPRLGNINGVPAVDFQTSSDSFYAEGASGTGIPYQPTTGFLTFFAVVSMRNLASPNTFGRIISCAATNSGANTDFNTTTNFTVTRAAATDEFSLYRISNVTTTTVADYNTPSLLTALFDNTSAYFYLNGTLVGSFASTGAFGFKYYAIAINITQKLTIQDNFTGLIGEEIMYYAALSTAQRQQVEGYLSWKWGLQGNLPSDHPYKNINIAVTPLPSLTLAPSLVPVIFNKSWNPLIITGGLSLWLDAADSSTISYSAGTTNITQWNDKSGNGRNATGYLSPQPTDINGVPAIQFGSADNTVKSNFDGSISNGTNNVSIFAVCTSDKTSTNPFNRLVSLATFNTTNDAFTAGFAAAIILGGNNNYFGGQRNGISLFGSTNIISTNVALQVAAIWQNGAFALYVNGSLYYQNTYTAQGLFTYANYAIGRCIQNGFPGSNPTFVWNGKIGEVIMNNAIISDLQRQATEGYLAWKWNLVGDLPLNHPFKNFPPPPP